MIKRFLTYSVLVIFLLIFCFLAVSLYITNENNISMAKRTVIEKTNILAELFREDMDLQDFVQVGHDTRLTVISSSGVVLADNRPGDEIIGNHLERPEIRAASIGLPAVHLRYSATHNIAFIYYALRVDIENDFIFIRGAVPVAEINAYLRQSLPLMVFLFLLFATIAIALVHRMIQKLVMPFYAVEEKLRMLTEGEYEPQTAMENYEEVNKIINGIDNIALLIKNNIDEINEERNKLNYIINSFNNGLVVIDKEFKILITNDAMCDAFNITADMLNKKLIYLISDPVLYKAIEDCVSQNKTALFEMPINGKIYLITIDELLDTDLTMVVLVDITASRENEKQREEFFANASHELKTPLAAIKGFNELTIINNKDENLNKYIDAIENETTRMMALIGDMLKLSELENKRVINPVSVSLASTIRDIKDLMLMTYNEKAIQFFMSGDALIMAEPEHIHKLMKNIIENAFRYNEQKGKVTVTIEEIKKTVRLTIQDTGIGISPQEQTKIFERFYRVEKSRSPNNGGTGLGLSIVKHICALYGWKIALKSRIKIGTEITIEFPGLI